MSKFRIYELLACATFASSACSHETTRAGTTPPTGESTAPGPSDPTRQVPDAGANADVADPLPAMIHDVGPTRVAEGYATDAGIPPLPPGPGSNGSNRGPTGPVRPSPSPAPQPPAPPPGQPGQPNPTPPTPTNPAPHR